MVASLKDTLHQIPDTTRTVLAIADDGDAVVRKEVKGGTSVDRVVACGDQSDLVGAITDKVCPSDIITGRDVTRGERKGDPERGRVGVRLTDKHVGRGKVTGETGRLCLHGSCVTQTAINREDTTRVLKAKPCNRRVQKDRVSTGSQTCTNVDIQDTRCVRETITSQPGIQSEAPAGKGHA